MAITLFYLVNSFQSNLPWAVCNPDWKNHSFLGNITCVPSNEDNKEAQTANTSMSSAELWFKYEINQKCVHIFLNYFSELRF